MTHIERRGAFTLACIAADVVLAPLRHFRMGAECACGDRQMFRVGDMPDRSDKFRKLATDCVAIARDVTDPGARATLLTMAQTWYDMANGPAINFDSHVREFNDHQMSYRPAVQQQQQIQPGNAPGKQNK
jgi:hypothetical protein